MISRHILTRIVASFDKGTFKKMNFTVKSFLNYDLDIHLIDNFLPNNTFEYYWQLALLLSVWYDNLTNPKAIQRCRKWKNENSKYNSANNIRIFFKGIIHFTRDFIFFSGSLVN